MEKESNNRFEKIEKLLIFFAYEIKRNTRHFFFFFFLHVTESSYPGIWYIKNIILFRPFLKVPFSRERCKRKWKISIGGGRDLRVIRATQSRGVMARDVLGRAETRVPRSWISKVVGSRTVVGSIPLPLPFFLFIRSFVIIIINIRPRSPRSVDRGREWCVCRYCRIRSARTKSLGIYNSFPSLYCITRG